MAAPRRRWLRFSLRTMLIAVTGCAVFFWWLKRTWPPYRFAAGALDESPGWNQFLWQPLWPLPFVAAYLLLLRYARAVRDQADEP